MASTSSMMCASRLTTSSTRGTSAKFFVCRHLVMTTLSLRTVLNHHVFRYSIMSRLPHATLATQHVTSCRSTCSANLSCYRRADKRSQLADTPASAMPLSTSGNIFMAATIVNAGARMQHSPHSMSHHVTPPVAPPSHAIAVLTNVRNSQARRYQRCRRATSSRRPPSSTPVHAASSHGELLRSSCQARSQMTIAPPKSRPRRASPSTVQERCACTSTTEVHISLPHRVWCFLQSHA